MTDHPPLTNAEKNRKLPWALAGDATNAAYIYLAMAGPIFLLFLDHLQLDKRQIGLLLALLPLAGLVAIVAGPLAARLGFKRVFLTFWLLRKFVLAGLILAPWVAGTWGTQAGFLYAAGVIGVFAVLRSIGESAFAPWSHEFIPVNRRGKYTAMQLILVMIAGALAVALGGRFLGDQPATLRFQVLFGLAFLFGLLSAFFYSHVPGGAPLSRLPQERAGLAASLAPLRDTRFVRLILGASMVNLGWGMLFSFMPLFYRDQIGLRADQVVVLDAVLMAGQLSTSFLWGWAADRYGGKPPMILGVLLMTMFPLALLFLPRESAYSNPAAWGLMFATGLIIPGWTIGFARTLFVDLIPAEHKSRYLPIHMTMVAATLGAGPLVAGFVLDQEPLVSGRHGWIHLDRYSPFALTAVLMLCGAAAIFWRIPTQGAVAVTRFAAMFIQGNPVAAMHAIFTHQYAGHEGKRIMAVERLGQTNSPLGEDELIEALFDPSFNVRYEAIVSVARTRRSSRLTEAMIRVLQEADADLRVPAAWALGRMGDLRAVEPLRAVLEEDTYPVLNARAARALGMLGDTTWAGRIRQRLEAESDPGIAVAYSASLAAMGEEEALPDLLNFLARIDQVSTRNEASLAIATLLGRDDQALRLWRWMHREPGDTLGGIMIGLRKRLTTPQVARMDARELLESIDRCTRFLAMERFEAGAAELVTILGGVDPDAYAPAARQVMAAMAEKLKSFEPERIEYLFLAVHALHVGLAHTVAPTATPATSQP